MEEEMKIHDDYCKFYRSDIIKFFSTGNIPVEEWTIEQVEDWAKTVVNEKHAEKLIQQEVDGM